MQDPLQNLLMIKIIIFVEQQRGLRSLSLCLSQVPNLNVIFLKTYFLATLALMTFIPLTVTICINSGIAIKLILRDRHQERQGCAGCRLQGGACQVRWLIGVVVLKLFYRNIRIPGVCLLEWKRLGLNEL